MLGRGTTCVSGFSRIALSVYASPKQVLKDILGQFRKLWALRGDECLYLDRQKTSDLFLYFLLQVLEETQSTLKSEVEDIARFDDFSCGFSQDLAAFDIKLFLFTRTLRSAAFWFCLML